MISSFGAIVFDLDDTLYPQTSFKLSGFRAVARVLDERGIVNVAVVQSELEKIMAEFSPSHPNMFDLLVERLDLDPGLVVELVERFREHRPDIEPYTHVVELLAELTGFYKLGLLTDGLLPVQRGKLLALGLDQFFDKILFSDETGRTKPDETLFEDFEREFGLSGSELVYVGDNPAKDFAGARKRGWRTVRTLTGEHSTVAAAPGYEADEETPTAGVWMARLLAERRGR